MCVKTLWSVGIPVATGPFKVCEDPAATRNAKIIAAD
jgi:hypothetical protein